jgi:hypothetical protein
MVFNNTKIPLSLLHDFSNHMAVEYSVTGASISKVTCPWQNNYKVTCLINIIKILLERVLFMLLMLQKNSAKFQKEIPFT